MAAALILGWKVAGLVRYARLAAGYAATITALEHFVAGRDVAAIRAERFPPELAWIDVDVDEEQRTVTASVLGLIRRSARVRPGLGATRERGRSAELPAELPDLVAAPPLELPWPDGSSPARTPLEGARQAALERALEEAFVEAGTGRARGTHAVAVAHGGRLVAERYAPGILPTTPLLGWSMTKTVTAVLVGRLVLQGRLDPQRPARVPAWSEPGDPRGAITLEHLLRMQSGLEFRQDYVDARCDSLNMLFASVDCGAYAAAKPLLHAPGTVWSYSDGTSNIVAGLVRRSAGATLLEQLTFPQRALFAPLGMDSAVISVDGSGTFVGSSLCSASARDWLRLGWLLAEDGVWRGERLLPEGWVDFLARATPGSEDRTYGAHVWRFDRELRLAAGGALHPAELDDVLYASGHDGQFLFVDRGRRVVLVRLGVRPAPPGFDGPAFAAAVLRAFDGAH